jgi:uncharacterized protein (DUF2141 family)
MKKAVGKIIAVVAVIFLSSSFTQPGGPVGFKVKVTSIRSAQGSIHVFLFNSAAGYPTNHAKAYKHLVSKAATGEVTFSVGDIPEGTYSIVAFHDKNGNNSFDKTWYGSPKEDYGFSNIPGEFCGTPSFQQTSFKVSAQTNSVTVNLMNMD